MALLILLRGCHPIKERREIVGITAVVLLVVQHVTQGHEQCVCFSGTDDGVERRNRFSNNLKEKSVEYCGPSKAI